MSVKIRRYIEAKVVEEGEEGSWVTINGRHLLIKDGETVATAFKRTTGQDLADTDNKVGSAKQTKIIKNTVDAWHSRMLDFHNTGHMTGIVDTFDSEMGDIADNRTLSSLSNDDKQKVIDYIKTKRASLKKLTQK
jgi:hypothetical protein